MADDAGYIDYYEILGVDRDAKPGQVRNTYKKKMKALVDEIPKQRISEGKLAEFLLEMAKLNAALIVLRDKELRQEYDEERSYLIDLEQRYREAWAEGRDDADKFRREFEGRIKAFLSKYAEEIMLGAGQDKECFEASGWDQNHERHASRILRHYRHRLHHQILERLPFTEVTRPQIDWDDRRAFVESVLTGEGR